MHGLKYDGLFFIKGAGGGSDVPYWQFANTAFIPTSYVSTLNEAILAFRVSEVTYLGVKKNR
jgi:hypothetical protein